MFWRALNEEGDAPAGPPNETTETSRKRARQEYLPRPEILFFEEHTYYIYVFLLNYTYYLYFSQTFYYNN